MGNLWYKYALLPQEHNIWNVLKEDFIFFMQKKVDEGVGVPKSGNGNTESSLCVLSWLFSQKFYFSLVLLENLQVFLSDPVFFGKG